MQRIFSVHYPHSYEITSICLLVILLACSTILAAIVNTIFTKFLQSQPTSGESIISDGSSIRKSSSGSLNDIEVN